MARLDGADTDATIGTRANSAFCTISNDVRPLTHRMLSSSGRRSAINIRPITLSTALCLPTSSADASSRPSGANSPAACNPPRRKGKLIYFFNEFVLNTDWR